MTTPGLVWLRDQRAVAEATKRGGGRRNPLTRRAVVAAAVSLLDTHGLADLSIRALATRLGTSPASLYWHVANKEELLDLVFDEALGEVDLEPGTDLAADNWQHEVRRLAAEFAALSVRHPWWPQLYSTRPSIGPCALRVSEQLIGTLRLAGFAGATLDAAETVFYDVVVGHVLIATTWQTWLHRTPHDIRQTQDYVLEASRAHPTLHEHITSLFEVPDRKAAERYRFEFAVDVLIHGLEAQRPSGSSLQGSPRARPGPLGAE